VRRIAIERRMSLTSAITAIASASATMPIQMYPAGPK